MSLPHPPEEVECGAAVTLPYSTMEIQNRHTQDIEQNTHLPSDPSIPTLDIAKN